MSNEPTSTDLVKKPASDLARPSYVAAGDTRGTEHLTKDDLQMPRLALAQKTSHEIDPTDPKYIDGLKFTDLFNSLTSEIYGKGPMEFVIVRADAPRYMEFTPLDQGGGVKDFNVPANDPRTQFTTDVEGKSVPPVATKFYDFVILMLPTLEPIALSFKSTGLKVARQLNALMKFRGGPIFMGKYRLSTGTAVSPKGTYAVFQVKNAGNVDEDTYRIAEQAYESFKDREIVIDREHGDAAEPADGDATGDTSFDTSKM